MIFRTISGAQYTLFDIEETEVVGLFTGKLIREAEHPLPDIRTGDSIDIDGEQIVFTTMPTFGMLFEYSHPVGGGCRTSAVMEIIEDDS